MSKKLTSQKAPDYKGAAAKFTGATKNAFGTVMLETEVLEGRNAGERHWVRADKAGIDVSGMALPATASRPDPKATRRAKKNAAKKPKSPTTSETISASALGPKLCYGLKVGQQLRKTFKGREIVVDITENGYEVDGQRFRTLTRAAVHITGYGISGPVFFGLATVTKKSA